MRRKDTGRRHAASVEVKSFSEAFLRTNDFGYADKKTCIVQSIAALHAYNMDMVEIHCMRATPEQTPGLSKLHLALPFPVHVATNFL